MDIHWFPGHMTKSLRMMEESVKLVDLIFYVVDARAPLSCINPSFAPIIGGKKTVYVINKSDMVTADDAEYWQNRLAQIGDGAVTVSSITAKSSAVSISIAKRLCKDKIEKMKSRGIKTSIRAMVIGVPNCGKSTLINNMCGKASTVTGNRAGVTRGKQWVRIGEYFEVLDTPGTLYPKLENKIAAQNLAFIGSIKDEVLDKNELAALLVQKLLSIDPNIILKKYNIEQNDQIEHIMLDIARSRGYLLKGNVADIDRTSIAVLDDFRKGKLGKICLDERQNDIGSI